MIRSVSWKKSVFFWNIRLFQHTLSNLTDSIIINWKILSNFFRLFSLKYTLLFFSVFSIGVSVMSFLMKNHQVLTFSISMIFSQLKFSIESNHTDSTIVNRWDDSNEVWFSGLYDALVVLLLVGIVKNIHISSQMNGVLDVSKASFILESFNLLAFFSLIIWNDVKASRWWISFTSLSVISRWRCNRYQASCIFHSESVRIWELSSVIFQNKILIRICFTSPAHDIVCSDCESLRISISQSHFFSITFLGESQSSTHLWFWFLHSWNIFWLLDEEAQSLLHSSAHVLLHLAWTMESVLDWISIWFRLCNKIWRNFWLNIQRCILHFCSDTFISDDISFWLVLFCNILCNWLHLKAQLLQWKIFTSFLSANFRNILSSNIYILVKRDSSLPFHNHIDVKAYFKIDSLQKT